MRLLHTLLFASISLPMSLLTGATLINEFGNSSLYIPDGTSTFTYTQNATALSISGADSGDTFYGLILGGTIDISSSPYQLELVASFNGTATSIFQIELYDTDGDSRVYNFNFTDFTVYDYPTTLIGSFHPPDTSLVDGFEANNVAGLGLNTAGSTPGASINLVLDRVSAIPEPASLMLGLLGFTAYAARRRRPC